MQLIELAEATNAQAKKLVARCAALADEYWNSAALQKQYYTPGEYINAKVKV